jgi:hypothetical protein
MDFQVILSYLLIGAGIGSYFWTLIPLSKAVQSKTWEPVPGTVTFNDIVLTRGGGGTGNRTFKPIVHYRYEVNGEVFEGDQIAAFLLTTSIRSHAESTLSRYPVHSQVVVYHDPRNPKKALLEPGFQRMGGFYLTLVVGAAFVGIGFFLLNNPY